MKIRIFTLALALAMLVSGCGGAKVTEPHMEETATTGETIAYVPLDDRPDNLERVVYLAESLNYQVAMPDLDLYRTRLNDQPTNANGKQFGDRGALLQWVLDQEKAGCDRYIISLDQLLSGGLVNSRAMSGHKNITMPDGRILTEYKAIQTLMRKLSLDPNNQIFLLDSVMRLAPTVGYQHWTLEEYNALRAYGMVPRRDLTDEELKPVPLELAYGQGKDGQQIDYAQFGLDQMQVFEYLGARGRKLELTHRLQVMLAQPHYSAFRLLVGIDDSAAEECIQKNEIAMIRKDLGEDDVLLSGVDDLAFKAVTRLYMEDTDWAGADVSVEYFGGTQDQPACDYDFQSLEHVMADHLDFFRLTPGAADPDMAILVLTQPADEAKAADYIAAIVDRVNACHAAQIPVTLIDAGNGRYGTAFHEALTAQTDLGMLLSYSGFLDMAIVTGTALSHGVARLAFLQNGTASPATDRAFARTLADSVLKDFAYKHIVRPQLLDTIAAAGGNPDNFWAPQQDITAYTAKVEEAMTAAAAPVVENLSNGNFISSLEPYALTGWGGVGLSNYRFPWDRAFEISMDIALGDTTEARIAE